MDFLILPDKDLYTEHKLFARKEGLLTFYLMLRTAKYLKDEEPALFEKYQNKIVYLPIYGDDGTTTKFHTLKEVAERSGQRRYHLHAYALLKPE